MSRPDDQKDHTSFLQRDGLNSSSLDISIQLMILMFCLSNGSVSLQTSQCSSLPSARFVPLHQQFGLFSHNIATTNTTNVIYLNFFAASKL